MDVDILPPLLDAAHIVYAELCKLQENAKKPVDDIADLEKLAVFFHHASEPIYQDTVNEAIGRCNKWMGTF